jgi:mono/diheme cytochrome c family protein
MRDPDILPQQQRENAEPFERHNPVPWPLLVVTVLMACVGAAYIVATSPNEPSPWGDGRVATELQGISPAGSASSALAALATVDGAAVFTARCVACHQATGLGLPGAFPPLAGSEWVVGSEVTLAAIVLHGVTGSIQVKGVAYAGAMPAFKEQLQDAEIAAVLTHIRRQWGNAADAVTAQSVAAVRQATSGRNEPFKGEAELSGLK